MSKVSYKVIGPCEVAGVTKGKKVELDPEKVNVRALVRAGHVEVADKKKSGDQEADGS